MARRLMSFTLLTSVLCATGCETGRLTDAEILAKRPAQVLTTVEVRPNSLSLEQGAMARIEVVARDQEGRELRGTTDISYVASDPTIAELSSGGYVIALAGGTVDITVTTRAAGIIKRAVVPTTVRAGTPSGNLALTAQGDGWPSAISHVTAGGMVEWRTNNSLNWAGVLHRMLYLNDRKGRVSDSLSLANGKTTLRIPDPGIYYYCSGGCWDAPDWGVIVVH